MKQLITILSVAIILVSCKSKNELGNQTKVLSAVDSSEFAAFQTWKHEQDMKKMKEANTVRYANHSSATTGTNTTTTTKKGWSNATKGAVIGGAGGAVIGGVVSKHNRAAGVLVGGVLGAGGGYAIGRSYDKKKGH